MAALRGCQTSDHSDPKPKPDTPAPYNRVQVHKHIENTRGGGVWRTSDMTDLDPDVSAGIVRRLAEKDPLDHDEGVCPLCESRMDPVTLDDHESGCPWRMAREALGYPDPPRPVLPDATIAAITPPRGKTIHGFAFVEDVVSLRGHSCATVRADALEEGDGIIDEETGERLVVLSRTKGILQVRGEDGCERELRHRANVQVPVPWATLERIEKRSK